MVWYSTASANATHRTEPAFTSGSQPAGSAEPLSPRRADNDRPFTCPALSGRRGVPSHGMAGDGRVGQGRVSMAWQGRVGVVLCGRAPHGVVWYDMVWHGTMTRYDMVWHSMVWCCVVWYGVEWYDSMGAWYGMVRHDDKLQPRELSAAKIPAPTALLIVFKQHRFKASHEAMTHNMQHHAMPIHV